MKMLGFILLSVKIVLYLLVNPNKILYIKNIWCESLFFFKLRLIHLWFDDFFLFIKNSYRIEFDLDLEKYELFPDFFFILISQVEVLNISFIKVQITSFNGMEKLKKNDNLISE